VVTHLDDLTDRYGRRSSLAARIIALVLVVGLVAGSGAYFFWVFSDRVDPEAQGDILTYDVRSDHLTVATLEVVRKTESTEATCVLSAVAQDGSVVGEVAVPVTDGPVRQTVGVEIRTERRATTVMTNGCATPGQPRART
jgi:flagellar basal body-associated protein FliL